MNSVIDYKEYFIRATEYAAVACSLLRGCGNKERADEAAVNAMRSVLANAPINAKISIGEGEIDEAPMLYIGEKLGNAKDDQSVMPLDIAVDPLECTKNCANNYPNAMTVLAVAPRGKLFSAPDTYMNKLVANRLYADVVSLDNSIKENIENISKVASKPHSDIKVIVLDRPRNEYIVEALKKLNVNIEMISDGDVAASLRVFEGNADAYMGIGSAPEGVIAATAARGLGGRFDGKLHFHTQEAKERAKKMSKSLFNEVIDVKNLCETEDAIFVATGVCDGWIPGVTFNGDNATTSTMLVDVMSSKIIKIENNYSVNEINNYINEGALKL